MVPSPPLNNREAAIPLLEKPALRDETDAAGEADVLSRTRGFAFVGCSAFCHALMSFFIRVAESSFHYPSVSAIIIRSMTSITLSLFYLGAHGLFHELLLPKKQLTLLTFRGLFGATSALCTFFALQYLPIGITMTILYASPAITSLLAAVFLNDAFTVAHLLTLVLNFTGIVFTSHGSYAAHPTGHLAMVGIVFALTSALSASTVFILVRAMGLRVHFVLGCLFYGFGCALIATVLGTPADVAAIVHNRTGTLFALLSALAGFGSQSMLTRGLQRIPPGTAAVVRSSNVPFSFLLGFLFLSEKPPVVSLLGVALVLASIASVAWQKRSDARPRTSYTPVAEPCR